MTRPMSTLMNNDAQPNPQDIDTELVHRAKAGQMDAFDLLVQRHSERAFRAAMSIVKSREDAEEVVQDAFLRVFRNLGKSRREPVSLPG